jgi:hypothetical protein
MSVLHSSSIRPFFMFNPRHHAFPNASSSKRETALLPNDNALSTASAFTECFEENLLPNGTFLPNSTHRSVSSLYQFLVLTVCHRCTTMWGYTHIYDACTLASANQWVHAISAKHRFVGTNPVGGAAGCSTHTLGSRLIRRKFSSSEFISERILYPVNPGFRGF